MRDRIMQNTVVAEEHKERRGPLIVAVVVLVVVIAVVAVVLGTRNDGDDGTALVTSAPTIGSTTPLPTAAPVTPAPTPLPSLTSDQQALLQHLKKISFDGGSSLENRDSPQFSAFWWLARTIGEGVGPTLNIKDMSERYALATLYYATNGDSEWFRTDGWLDPEVHICEWEGIIDPAGLNACYGAGLRVLDLGGNNLVGSPVPELGHLDRLHLIDLSANVLTGSLATELFLMTRLSDLNIANNQLSGNIPTEIGLLSFLSHLDISGNGE